MSEFFGLSESIYNNIIKDFDTAINKKEFIKKLYEFILYEKIGKLNDIDHNGLFHMLENRKTN